MATLITMWSVGIEQGDPPSHACHFCGLKNVSYFSFGKNVKAKLCFTENLLQVVRHKQFPIMELFSKLLLCLDPLNLFPSC